MGVQDFWNEYAETERPVFISGDLEPGRYTAKVTKCAFGKTNAGEDKVEWHLQMIDGPEPGHYFGVHRKFSKTDTSDENQKNIRRLLDDFKNLGLECTSDKIAASMAAIVGQVIEFKIVEGNQGGLFTNFVQVVKGGTVFPEEEIPF
jgi:hypothetical protein